MKTPDNRYCVILAGGRGRRLWPVSRRELPKQFIDFFGTGRTLLQSTFDRFSTFIPRENILLCTNEAYAGYVREQLPELPEGNIMAEPVHRNTAASAAWATKSILMRNEQAVVVVSPADQVVLSDDKFRLNVSSGLSFAASNEVLLALGAAPTRPEPGYGYIQLGEEAGSDGVFRVQSFTEKPDREFARMFVDSGEFLWNTGIFIASATYLRSRFIQIFPEVIRHMRDINPGDDISDRQQFMATHFSLLPNISLDKGMLELNERACVMRCDFGWADMGTWHGIYESMQRTEGDNVVVNSDVVLEECSNNIICLPKGRLGVINGLDGFIVAEKDNVLLICKKGDSSSLLRKYANEIGIKYGDSFV